MGLLHRRALAGIVLVSCILAFGLNGQAGAEPAKLDLDGDGVLTVGDVSFLTAVYDHRNGDPGWDSRYDQVPDGRVDLLDLSRVALAIGRPAAVKLSVDSAGLIANGQDSAFLTATIVDAIGNVVPSFNGAVTFAASSPAVARPETAIAEAGLGVARTRIVAGTQSGTTLLAATVSGLQGSLLQFSTVAQVASKLVLTADPSTIAATADSEGRLTVSLLDQAGVIMVSPLVQSVQVRLTSSNMAVVRFAGPSNWLDLTLTDAEATVPIYGTTQPGTATISANVVDPGNSGITTLSANIATTMVGGVDRLAIDPVPPTRVGPVMVVVRALDSNGNQVTRFTGTLSASVVARHSDGTTSVGFVVPVANGRGVATVMLGKAGEYTLVANAADLLGGQTNLTLSPGPKEQVRLQAIPPVLAADGTHAGVLKVTFADANGNRVQESSTVTVTKVVDNGATSFTNTTQLVDGEAFFPVVATTKVATDEFVASSPGLSGASAVVSTVIMGTPHQLRIPASLWGTAGRPVQVAVQVLDGAGGLVSKDNGRLVTLKAQLGANLIATGTGLTENGTAVIPMTLTTAGDYTLTASADGLQSMAEHLGIAPNTAASLAVIADRPVLVADGASKATISVALRDVYGNLVAANTDTTIYLIVNSGTNVADFEGGKNGIGLWPGWVKLTLPAGSSSVSTVDGVNSLVAKTVIGTASVTVRAPSLGLGGALSVETRIVGLPYALAVTLPPATTVGELQPLEVRLTDAMGNLRSGDSTSTVSLTFAPGGSSVTVYADPGRVTAYTPGSSIPVHKGIATFYIRDTRAETFSYTLSGPWGIQATASGSFTAGPAVEIAQPTASPAEIHGDGSSTTVITGRIIDEFGNTAGTNGGTMHFSIRSGSDYAFLQDSSAPVVNGQAKVIAQASHILPGASSPVVIRLQYDLNEDGDMADPGEVVDGTAFTVVGVP
ncbi:MAG TPA: invasin domain 3-containing protein [Symbiobacteriaceae bacterium]|jgi:adhesin/invasin